MAVKKERVERHHPRLNVRNLNVKAKISIYNVFGVQTDSNDVPVLLQSLSPLGFEFLTHLRFPVSSDYTIRAFITMGEWQFSILGHIVWRRRDENLYAYGCSFLVDSRIRIGIVRALYESMTASNPAARRVHELYRKMTETEEYAGRRSDIRS
jgi:hypothetical protein